VSKSPVIARQIRPSSRMIAGYTITCRNGLIAAILTVLNSPFGVTKTAIWAPKPPFRLGSSRGAE
jgi:hypothetical protein